MFFSDEGVIVNQFYNFMHGSLDLKVAKVEVLRGIFITVNNHLYGRFSYSLLILSSPAYFFLKNIDSFYGAHLFLMQLWAISGGVVIYLAAKYRKIKNAAIIGLVSYLILILANLRIFTPIYFPKWGEIISIEFTNILVSSLLVTIVYLLFRDIFGNRVAIFASFFTIFATPVSFYAITLKHHSLALLLTLLAIYSFYKYLEKKEARFVYFAYLLAGLCVWTRISEGAALLFSLVIVDILLVRRSAKHIVLVLMIILVSLIPIFTFNQLILGNPFTIIETYPLSDTPMKMRIDENMIVLKGDPVQAKQMELLDKLGFSFNPVANMGFINILGNISILKLGNTFGILLVSPFLIAGIMFIADRLKRKVALNTMDKFLGLFAVVFILLHTNYILSIITDTPIVLEYRYLLVLYLVLLYFALRVDMIRNLIEKNARIIGMLYMAIGIILVSSLLKIYPPAFLNIYYTLGLATVVSLIIIFSLNILLRSRHKSISGMLEKTWVFLVALSLAEASVFLLFYYWVVTISYISPSQNYAIVPIMGNIIHWMYGTLL